MKIVEIIPQLSSGGAERFVVDLSNELSHRHDVTLIVSASIEGNEHIYHSEISKRVNIYSLRKKVGLDLRYVYRLYKSIKRVKPDVVHTHISAFSHFAILKWLFPKVKFVHTVHSDAQFESGGKVTTILKKIFFKRGWANAVTISDASTTSFANFYGENVKRTLIYNGRSLAVIPSKTTLIPRIEGRFNFVSIGHISHNKNHIMLCSAITKLTQQGAPIELYMFGRTVNDDIVKSINALNNPHIHILGEREIPMQYLSTGDAYCMTSKVEGMPISLIEALACGLIPICTAVGGIVDMVDDGNTGFLSYDLTTESYIKAIERFLALSHADIESMKQRCKDSAKQYSIERCAAQYETLFGKQTMRSGRRYLK